MADIKLLTLIIIITALGYLTYEMLKKKIQPALSGKRLVLFMITYLASIMLWVFLFGLIIFNFKDFFFK